MGNGAKSGKTGTGPMEDVDAGGDVVIDQEGDCIQATDQGLDCLVWDVTKNINGSSAPQVVDSFPSGVERVFHYPVDQITRVPTLRARTH